MGVVQIEKEILMMQKRNKWQVCSAENTGFIHSNRNEIQEDEWAWEFVVVLSSDSFFFGKWEARPVTLMKNGRGGVQRLEKHQIVRKLNVGKEAGLTRFVV